MWRGRNGIIEVKEPNKEPNNEPDELNKELNEPNNKLNELGKSYLDTKVYERKSIILKNME